MEVVKVLRMNGGMGDTSYSNNSLLQRKVILMTKPIIEQELIDLYYEMKLPKTIVMADLGCSSGPNTLLVASELIKTVDTIQVKIGHKSLEIQIYLNDLPGNDFNTIFMSLPEFHDNLDKEMSSPPSIYFAGIPGSFYTRLVPAKSLHFVHSSYSLMWLSQVPKVGATNKGKIYMSSTSPASTIKAYYDQFQSDFSTFLKCRGEEMVSGGRMVLTILGRKCDDPRSKECCYIWDLLAMALNDMVAEGVIEEEKMDAFNIPQYTPSPKEVKKEVEKEGSFKINRLQVSEVNWDAYHVDDNNIPQYTQSPKEVQKKVEKEGPFKINHVDNNNINNNNNNNSNNNNNNASGGYNVAKCMRAVAEPLLLAHFGASIIDEVFVRYKNIVADRISKEKPHFVNVTVSMIRKP